MQKKDKSSWRWGNKELEGQQKKKKNTKPTKQKTPTQGQIEAPHKQKIGVSPITTPHQY